MIHDFVKKTDALKADLQKFLLSPDRWRTSRVSIPLTWQYLKFDAANRSSVPKSAGVYAFVVSHSNSHFPGHGFIMYIGITGSNSNGRTLHLRYGDYLREQVKNKRPKVFYMLDKYANDLQFAFSPIEDPAIDLQALELDLNDAIIPPVVVKDFSADIRQLVKAMS